MKPSSLKDPGQQESSTIDASCCQCMLAALAALALQVARVLLLDCVLLAVQSLRHSCSSAL
eukprot:1157281-Pelagomonas_calceolata.AAC.6